MNRATYRTYEPVSLAPADGWRAVYVLDPGEGEPGWQADALIAWGVFEVTERPVAGSAAPERRVGREIHGVIIDGWAPPGQPGPVTPGFSPMCVAEVANFWRYLGPGEPDPDPAEVAKAQAEQARRDEALRGRRPATTRVERPILA
jgi:hypothetical protein